MMRRILGDPPLMIILSFAIAICAGTLILKLPFATHNGISLIDALFTITSATCVTGLIVVDTATYFTIWGKIIILIFIQIGGLGILTLSTMFMGILSGRIGISGRGFISESLTQDFVLDFYKFLKRLIYFVTGIEVLGAVLLFIFFIRTEDFIKSIWLSIFHSISAFCNAGFSLFSDSLEPFRGSIHLNIVIMVLIICGGLGFVVINELYEILKTKKIQLSFHSKVVLSTTLCLILFGACFIFFIEQNYSFFNFTFKEKILSSFFQSVTARTTGFNTVPVYLLKEATALILITLMFIGGSPGSTAGGIKTTSFAIFFSLIISRIRGRPRPELLRRTVSKQTVERVFTLILISLLILTLCIFILLLSEIETVSHKTNSNFFLSVIFEAFSAFGTVGLSLGITQYLTNLGKLVIIILMFIGRTGPLTLAILMMQGKEELEFQYPEEEIMIG
ncbi:MAG: TrkH family potassium uptake protein [Candidatus Hydrogenedentota bacterium]